MAGGNSKVAAFLILAGKVIGKQLVQLLLVLLLQGGIVNVILMAILDGVLNYDLQNASAS
jgi:hypothetical protein